MTTPLAARYLEVLTDRLGLDALEDQDGDIVIRKQKGACVTIGDEGQLVITAEMLVAPPNCLPSADHLAAVLPRALSMLIAATRTLTTDLAILELEASLNE